MILRFTSDSSPRAEVNSEPWITRGDRVESSVDFSIKINRAVCLSGYIDKSLLKEDIYSYRDIIAYSSHGTNDPVIPFDWAKTSIESLKENNPNVVFNSFQDAHNVSQENFQSILNWL